MSLKLPAILCSPGSPRAWQTWWFSWDSLVPPTSLSGDLTNCDISKSTASRHKQDDSPRQLRQTSHTDGAASFFPRGINNTEKSCAGEREQFLETAGDRAEWGPTTQQNKVSMRPISQQDIRWLLPSTSTNKGFLTSLSEQNVWTQQQCIYSVLMSSFFNLETLYFPHQNTLKMDYTFKQPQSFL